jgi:uncharacterized Zn-binding protein involved in type VI secretion
MLEPDIFFVQARGECMAGEIIRLGDRTSHGGVVIEGSPSDICMGKPIAFVGHKVQCPRCKGVYPIVEGAPVTTFYGKGVALAGMRTACGALLIASQFTDIVECGGGPGAADQTSSSALRAAGAAPSGTKRFDDKFVLLDADTDSPLAFTEYAIRRAWGAVEHGTTDAAGHTHLLSATTSAEVVEIYV